jgi:hypothetical protein
MGRAVDVGADVDAIGFTTTGAGAVELPIHEEIPPRYPLLLLLLVLAALVVLAVVLGATPVVGVVPDCCGRERCGAPPVGAVPGAPTIRGSPSSVIRFDSCCTSSNSSRTTRKASCLTSVIGSNNNGMTLGITFVAKSCLVNSVFDIIVDLSADKRHGEKGSFIDLT